MILLDVHSRTLRRAFLKLLRLSFPEMTLEANDSVSTENLEWNGQTHFAFSELQVRERNRDIELRWKLIHVWH